MTVHISADVGDVADSVLLPGDPLRAKFIAEHFFEKPCCYNSVRGMLGFTGLFRGKRVSVQGTGMGMPSFSIYANELIQLGVKRMIRVGSCGSLQQDVYVRDIILATSASTDSGIVNSRFQGINFSPVPNANLLNAAAKVAKRNNVSFHQGSVFTSDLFYSDREDGWRLMSDYGVLGIEMETYELYTLAMRHRIESLSILTVSDHMLTGESTSSLEREQNFKEMIEIALEIC